MSSTSRPALDPQRLAHVRHVRVGSTNGPKIEAVRAALAPYVDVLQVEGCEVPSGVPEQPVGLDEIIGGARNRAFGAIRKGRCDLAVGIEDGLIELPEIGPSSLYTGDELRPFQQVVLNVGAACLMDGRRESLGLSSAFMYPGDCVAPALSERAPIGDVFDALWHEHHGSEASGGEPSGRSIGNIGKLSLGVLPRSDYARHAVVCALVRFLHPELYRGAA